MLCLSAQDLLGEKNGVVGEVWLSGISSRSTINGTGWGSNEPSDCACIATCTDCGIWKRNQTILKISEKIIKSQIGWHPSDWNKFMGTLVEKVEKAQEKGGRGKFLTKDYQDQNKKMVAVDHSHTLFRQLLFGQHANEGSQCQPSFSCQRREK